MTPKPLSEREQELIAFYVNCQLGLSPRRFYSKWAVSHEAIANICTRSPSTVKRWFGRGKHYRTPNSNDLRHLAIMDFLLEHFEDIPVGLLEILCPDFYQVSQVNSDQRST